MTLTDAEVRERFSAYYDGELPPEEMAFIKKRLAEDKALEAEFQAFRKMLGGLASLGLDSADLPKSQSEEAAQPRVDLLAGVQDRLRKRSGGKFYKNRFTRAAGLVPLEAIAVLVLVVLVLVYVGMTYVSELRSAGESTGPARPPPTQQTPPSPPR